MPPYAGVFTIAGDVVKQKERRKRILFFGRYILNLKVGFEKIRKAGKVVKYVTEYEKIKEVITKYKEFFENTITDVGHTEKGRWFFFQKEENQTQYRSFVEFDTAEALEQLILEAVAEEMNVMVKTTTEALVYEVRDIDVNGAGSIEGSIAELARYIKILNKERQNNAKMVDMLFRSLEGAAGRIIEGTEVRK